MKKITLIISLCIASIGFAQYTNFNSQRNWSLNKKEIVFGLGATQFTGDLGGRNQIGKDFSMRDIDFPTSSIGGLVGYRYRFHPFFATSTTLNIGMLRGSDTETAEIIRNSRNLHFRSMYFELQQRIEFVILANEKFGSRSSNRNGFKNRNEQLYLFTGVGVSYFNPQAQYNGEWVDLDPLNTEGQGLEGGAEETLPVTATIPFGIGFKMGIGKVWRIGVEASYVKTFSDYIDDVSGVYYDPTKLASPEAQLLSNPANNNTSWFAPGQQRGDANNDAYYTFNLVVSRNLTYKYRGGSRGKMKYNSGRYKF
jgi:hypothetical protein